MGFGDFNPSNDASRGLIFPYSVGGIIILGLMISSIQKFAQEISHDNIVKTHAEKRRVKTIDRSVSNTVELEQKRIAERANKHHLLSVPSVTRKEHGRSRPLHRRHRHSSKRSLGAASKLMHRVRSRGQKIVLLQAEKDRFDAMRSIQESTSNFKKYSALTTSVIACRLSVSLHRLIFYPRSWNLHLPHVTGPKGDLVGIIHAKWCQIQTTTRTTRTSFRPIPTRCS